MGKYLWNDHGSGPYPDGMDEPASVFVVIAAFNEGGAVGPVIRELRERWPQVIVVDDGSTDDTAVVARNAGATVIRHIINRGQGAALQTGITYALRHGCKYVITFDADGQHRPEDITALLSALQEKQADFALGSRFLDVGSNVPRARRALLGAAVWFTWLTSGIKLTDAHNGLRGMTRRGAQTILITLDRMAHASEIIDQVRESDLAFTEVPVEIRYTDYSMAKGQSSGNAFRIAADYLIGKFFA